MINTTTFTLINPQNGNLAFKLSSFENNSPFDHIQRHNYYSVIWLKSGTGVVKVDVQSFDFSGNMLLAFSPYQPFMLSTDDKMEGIIINFHPDFFCIHKHQQEVACNGVLFNNIYEPPFVSVDEKAEKSLKCL